MLWNWYTVDACFLSSSWHVKNGAMFAASCVGVVLLVGVEFLRRLGKEYDELIVRQARRRYALQHAAAAVAAAPLDGPAVVTFRATVVQQLARALLHAATFAGAYIVMLLAMYFNGYIMLCIFLGAGLGKFLCDWLVVKVDVDPRPSPVKGIQEPSVCCG